MKRRQNLVPFLTVLLTLSVFCGLSNLIAVGLSHDEPFVSSIVRTSYRDVTGYWVITFKNAGFFLTVWNGRFWWGSGEAILCDQHGVAAWREFGRGPAYGEKVARDRLHAESISMNWTLFGFAVLSGLLGLLILWLCGRRAFRRRRNLCVECGYDLTGNVSGRCPECGCSTVGRRAGPLGGSPKCRSIPESFDG